MSSSSTSALAAGVVLLLAVLGGTFALAWNGIVSGAEALSVVTGVVGLAGGIIGVHSGVSAGTAATSSSWPVYGPPAPPATVYPSPAAPPAQGPYNAD